MLSGTMTTGDADIDIATGAIQLETSGYTESAPNGIHPSLSLQSPLTQSTSAVDLTLIDGAQVTTDGLQQWSTTPKGSISTIPELFDRLLEMMPQKDLLSLSLTHPILSDRALDFLWREPQSLLHLFALLPSRLVTTCNNRMVRD